MGEGTQCDVLGGVATIRVTSVIYERFHFLFVQEIRTRPRHRKQVNEFDVLSNNANTVGI